MPNPSRTDREIEDLLSVPPSSVVETARRLRGDCAVLGVGGKMGTTTALMLRRALDAAGRRDVRVLGVSRFSRPETRAALEEAGIATVSCDLADARAVATLPEAAEVLYLAGQKFGTSDAPELTWIQNTVVPALVAQRYPRARTVVFSTGCVYPFADTAGPGSRESDPLAFLGEYASSCVGRERVFTHYSKLLGTPQLHFRLNYAVELRYGVLVDIALKVRDGVPVDVTMGWLNCVWQGDACARAIRCLELASSPPRVLNVTGDAKLSVRALAHELARRLGRAAVVTGAEAPTAWLADASESVRRFGPPETPLDRMLDLVADHVAAGGTLLGKPTHFETRSGKF